MKIDITITVNVPISPFCKNCERKEYSERDKMTYCTVFNRYLFIHHGDFMKCRECYTALYDAIELEV